MTYDLRPCANGDLIELLVMLHGPDLQRLGRYQEVEVDVGGTLIRSNIFRPFEKTAPWAVIETDTWKITFFLPKNMPNMWDKKVIVHLTDVTFHGDLEHSVRDLTFAKMM